MTPSAASERRQLVLVGGGHTHVQVLRRFAMEPPERTLVTVVLDRPVAIYSGMVPGFVAGQYAAHELEIDVVPLARRAGARVILSAATGLDPAAKRIHLADRPSIPYDVASFDIGSTVIGLDLPGVREHAIPTRPIARLVRRIEEVLEEARRRPAGSPFRVAVVGGGAGGVELAFTLDHRLRAETAVEVRTTLIHAGERLMIGYPEALRQRIRRAAERRDIEVELRSRVVEARSGEVVMADGRTEPCDALVWVAGATAHPLFRDSPQLRTDDRGFALTRPTLQLLDHDDVFAAGDCGTLVDFPDTAKAGVYAVRQGPFLIDNLRLALARLDGDSPTLRDYRPQRDFLTLLNLGDGTALGSKGSFAFGGRWVMRLKDWIDRRFMRLFQVLEPGGDLSEQFAGQPAMAEGEPMWCGGCAAKVGQSSLERALDRLHRELPPPEDGSVIVGLEQGDDVSVHRTPRGEVVVSSVDLFRAFTDDPWLVGRVAALNALSDLEAKGVSPSRALAVVSVPEELGRRETEETLYQILAGARSVLDRARVSLLGGHSTTAPVLQVGFSVEGDAPDPATLLTLDRLQPGDALVLTRPLGTGVVLHADMQGRCPGPWLEDTLAAMQGSNAAAGRLAVELGAHAATDVTGFGLAGHLGNLARASGVGVRLELDTVPALAGALELLGLGLRSTAHAENARARSGLHVDGTLADDPRVELLFDPQTNGGLLIGIEAARSRALVELLHDAGDRRAAVIGAATAGEPAIHILAHRR